MGRNGRWKYVVPFGTPKLLHAFSSPFYGVLALNCSYWYNDTNIMYVPVRMAPKILHEVYEVYVVSVK